MVFMSSSAGETEALGEKLAGVLFPGAVLALWGDLGAGKTAFVRGLARGLGVRGRVSSPTFTLLHEHPGAPPLYHFDLYRLSEGGLADIGAEEYLNGDGVCAIEWPGNAGGGLPAERLDVEILPGAGDGREIGIKPRGARYEEALGKFIV